MRQSRSHGIVGAWGGPNARDTTSFPLDRLACTDTVLIAATDKLLAFELADPLTLPRRHAAAVNVCGCRTAPALPASTAVFCSMKRAASPTLRKSSVAPDGARRRSRSRVGWKRKEGSAAIAEPLIGPRPACDGRPGNAIRRTGGSLFPDGWLS